MLTGVHTQPHEFTAVVDTLLANVRDLLDSPDPKTRVRAIHHLAAGVEALERRVVFDAQSAGLTWAQIGAVYGVSRQAAHRRFSNETIMPSDHLGELLEDLDVDDEAIPTIAGPAKLVRRVTGT